MVRKTLMGLSFIILQSSCVSTQIASLKATGNKDIPVYMVGTPTPEFTPNTYIEASGGIFTNKKQLLNKLKTRAGKEQNTDALVNVRFGYQGIWPYVDGITVTTKK